MEMMMRLSFVFFLLQVVMGSKQAEDVATDSLPAPWSRSEILARQKRLANRYSRPTAGNSRRYVAQFDQALDAKEWLERLLSSLVDEPLAAGTSESRSPAGQRIFQREARPSSGFASQTYPAENKRFSLASVRVNPQSLKRQLIYPTPNMGLVQLEAPVKFRNADPVAEVEDSYQPQQVPYENEEPIRPPPYYGESVVDHTGETEYPGDDTSGQEPAAVEQQPRVINVDVYVKYHP